MGCLLGDAKGAPISSGRMTLLWSPESIHDLLALRAHIAEHDPAAAKRVALHILYCVEYLLLENPKLGAPGRVPLTGRPENREYPSQFGSHPGNPGLNHKWVVRRLYDHNSRLCRVDETRGRHDGGRRLLSGPGRLCKC